MRRIFSASARVALPTAPPAKTMERDAPGKDAKVKESTKVERDSAGNVTHTETDVKK